MLDVRKSPAEAGMPNISRQIWDMKYRLKDADKTPVDLTVEDTWSRIARALAEAEPEEIRAEQEARFYKALEGFRYLPAGRITAGAGTGRNVTLFNCLHGDTPILTRERGLVPIRSVAGETVHVSDGNGDWVPAPIHDHGVQDLIEVEVGLGATRKNRRVIRATPGHRWVLADGREATTAELNVGDLIPVSYAKKRISDDVAYARGVAHGIIYGDGSEGRDGDTPHGFQVRLCGEKVELMDHLLRVGMTSSTPPSCDGDAIVRIPRSATWADLKSLPADAGPDYLLGFLRGWFATDGCVGGRDGYPVLSCGEEGVAFLKTWGPVAGFFPKKATELKGDTNFGPRKARVWNVAIANWALEEADLLRAKHRSNRTVTSCDWKVTRLEPAGQDRVYCPEVSTTQSFTISDAVLTRNCFVMGTVPDSMEGIFEMLKEAALTMQQGGGIGYDFSTIRPKGARVKGVGSDASGPLSFMDVWDAMCGTIMSAGSRRGAMMATMRCDHPDIEDFITAKRDPARLRKFNVSVLVTDAFMAAVEAGADWDLTWQGEVWRTVKARDLWNRIMESTYAFAEPGVIFIDRINERNPLAYVEHIAATNPCGEQPLPPYGACLLGSINLAKLIESPFSDQARMDEEEMEELVATAVRMMDNVVDVSRFPLPQQLAEAKAKRRIGLGVTGVADALLMLRLTYGTEEAAAQLEAWMRKIQHAAYRASVDLAKEKGAFPLFDAEKYLASPTIQDLDRDLQDAIREHGIRNALLTSIAPTGTISLYAGNVSSGIEPVFAYSYKRKITLDDGSKAEEEVVDYAVQLYRDMFGPVDDSDLPEYFVSAQTLKPLDHVRMQAAAQKWVDSSISKTVNCPEDIPFEEFKAVYEEAFRSGCKGCTTYRPNDITGSVLSVEQAPKKIEPTPVMTASPSGPMPRDPVLEGRTYKIRWPGATHAYYMTVNDVVDADGVRRPFEVFINTQNTHDADMLAATTRMISAVFRRGGDIGFVAEELSQIVNPQGGHWVEGRYVPSLVALIGAKLFEHLEVIGFLAPRSPASTSAASGPVPDLKPVKRARPGCGTPDACDLVMESGCEKCVACGWSKCG